MSAARSEPQVTRRSVVGGLAWKLGRQAVAFGSQLVVTLILANLLTPGDFGVAAMVLGFAGVVALLTDLSFGSALIQRERITEADRSTAFWTSLGAGAVLGALAVAASGAVAGFYHEPEVRWLFAAFGLAFLLEALSTTQGALLTRELRFRDNETRIILATLVSAVAAIVLAVAGAGAWALIGQALLSAAVSAALLWRVTTWRPSRTYSRESLRHFAGFGGSLLLTRALWLISRNAVIFLLGRLDGSAALGLYTLSFTITLAPLTRIAIPIQSVFFPAFSRLRDPQAIGAIWLRANRLVAALAMPALLGLMVVAPEFVPVVLGDRWSGAVPVMRVLAYVGIIQSLQGFNAAILSSLGRTGLLLRTVAVVTAVSLVAFVAGAPHGPEGVAIAYAVTSTIAEPWAASRTAQAIGLSLRAMLGALSGVAAAAVVMALGVVAVQQALQETGLPVAVRLAAEVLCGIALYLPLCRWRAPEVLDEVRRLRGDLRPPRA